LGEKCMPNPADNPTLIKLIEKLQTETDPMKVTELTEEFCRVLDEDESRTKRLQKRKAPCAPCTDVSSSPSPFAQEH
jgi:hypothetical protein